jgi:hypothetical protein
MCVCVCVWHYVRLDLSARVCWVWARRWYGPGVLFVCVCVCVCVCECVLGAMREKAHDGGP